jgi:hypothetical protein
MEPQPLHPDSKWFKTTVERDPTWNPYVTQAEALRIKNAETLQVNTLLLEEAEKSKLDSWQREIQANYEESLGRPADVPSPHEPSAPQNEEKDTPLTRYIPLGVAFLPSQLSQMPSFQK